MPSINLFINLNCSLLDDWEYVLDGDADALLGYILLSLYAQRHGVVNSSGNMVFRCRSQAEFGRLVNAHNTRKVKRIMQCLRNANWVTYDSTKRIVIIHKWLKYQKKLTQKKAQIAQDNIREY